MICLTNGDTIFDIDIYDLIKIIKRKIRLYRSNFDKKNTNNIKLNNLTINKRIIAYNKR